MSSEHAHAAAAPLRSDYRIKPGSPWANAWKISAAVGVVGLAAAAYGYTLDENHEHFAFSYLFGFFTLLTIGLGGLFFVIVQYLTKAGWSVTVRRTAEFLMAGLPAFAVLVIPLIFTMRPLFHEWLDQKPTIGAHQEAEGETAEGKAGEAKSHERAAPSDRNDPDAYTKELEERREAALERAEVEEKSRVLHEKAPYLNDTFFRVRTGAYVAIWIFLAWRFFSWSTDQDKSKKADNTASAQRFAPIAAMLFALTITFAAFDWLMALDPFWYSTIFGVYIFALSTVVNMAMLILITLGLRNSGVLGDAVNVEHFHDMGKLLFGWLVFYGYISFAQFFLIWYGNIPEELTFFMLRWHDNHGTWKPVTLINIGVHFIVPFWLLMSRNVKRRVEILGVGAALLVLMHVVEMYWIVMPNRGDFAPHWLDLACLLGVGGVYFAVVLRTMAQNPVIPVGDPRLVRALKFENA